MSNYITIPEPTSFRLSPTEEAALAAAEEAAFAKDCEGPDDSESFHNTQCESEHWQALTAF